MKALPYALEHGLFVVFVCVVLVLNSLTLAAGAGMTTIVLNVMILALTGFWHGVGFLLRRRVHERKLAYRQTPSRNGHSRGAAMLRQAGDTVRNAPRVILRWFYATGTGGRAVTVATFALPIVLAIALPLLGPVDFDFVPAVQNGRDRDDGHVPAGHADPDDRTSTSATSKRAS